MSEQNTETREKHPHLNLIVPIFFPKYLQEHLFLMDGDLDIRIDPKKQSIEPILLTEQREPQKSGYIHEILGMAYQTVPPTSS